MEQKISTQTVNDPEGRSRHFHYFLTSEEVETKNFTFEHYGVRIAEENGDCASISSITTSAERIDQLLTLLVKNQVGPAALADVVADWL